MLESRKHLLAFIHAGVRQSVFVRTNAGLVVQKSIKELVAQVRRQLHAAKMAERPDIAPHNIRIIQVYSSLADIEIGIDIDMSIKFVLQVHSENVVTKSWWLVVPNSNVILSDGIINTVSPFSGTTAFTTWLSANTPRKSLAQKRLIEHTIQFYLKHLD